MKNPQTPAGIKPATFRFVAQHLNHCANAVPDSSIMPSQFILLYYAEKQYILARTCIYIVQFLFTIVKWQ